MAFPECEYGEGDNQGLLDTQNRVSRKAEFVPPVCSAMGSGWAMPDEAAVVLEASELIGETDGPKGFMVRVPSGGGL